MKPYLCRRMMLAGLGLHVVTIVSNAFLVYKISVSKL